MDLNEEIEFRLYDASTDKGFVYSTFLEGLYFGNEYFNAINKVLYFENYPRVLEAIMANPVNSTVMACLKADPEVLVGYAIGSPGRNLMHYTFVKRAWRKQGVARALAAATVPEIVTVTHLTKPGAAIVRKKDWIFNPFIV